MPKHAARLALALLASACGPDVPIDADGTISTSGDDDGTTTFASGDPTPTTSAASTSSTTTRDVSSGSGADTSSSGDGGDGGTVFIGSIDAPQEECDLWVDDCPPGTKCMPWASDNSWSHTRCNPIVEDPNQVGEPCTVEGSGISGIDDCEQHSMCWHVDPETNTGTCVAMCSGDPSEPVCPDPCTSCVNSNNGLIILCLEPCDPLGQDCSKGSTCYPSGDTFACAPTAQNDAGAGDACENDGVCGAMACAAAELVPDCAGKIGCCTPFCAVGDDSSCAAVLPGTECIPWFDNGEAPPCFASAIGSCLLP